MSTPKTSTKVLVEALRALAMDIQSKDGVANAAIAEAAGRLEKTQAENTTLWAKVEIQATRIRKLEGATNHAGGTPLSRAQAERDRLAVEWGALQAENKALREDKQRLDWVERLDATITSDGGYGRALTWFCGYKNEKEVVRLLRPSLREAIDSARAKSSEGGGS